MLFLEPNRYFTILHFPNFWKMKKRLSLLVKIIII
jgi:hypothetical protein